MVRWPVSMTAWARALAVLHAAGLKSHLLRPPRMQVPPVRAVSRHQPPALTRRRVAPARSCGPWRHVIQASTPGSGRQRNNWEQTNISSYKQDKSHSFYESGGLERGDPLVGDVHDALLTAVAVGGLNVAFVAVCHVHPSTSCWPPSMSKVAPVTAVLVMR